MAGGTREISLPVSGNRLKNTMSTSINDQPSTNQKEPDWVIVFIHAAKSFFIG